MPPHHTDVFQDTGEGILKSIVDTVCCRSLNHYIHRQKAAEAAAIGTIPSTTTTTLSTISGVDNNNNNNNNSNNEDTSSTMVVPAQTNELGYVTICEHAYL